MKWIYYENNWFNLDDFCHIWIEESDVQENGKTVGYFLVGLWKHNGENKIISELWESLDKLQQFLHIKLETYKE